MRTPNLHCRADAVSNSLNHAQCPAAGSGPQVPARRTRGSLPVQPLAAAGPGRAHDSGRYGTLARFRAVSSRRVRLQCPAGRRASPQPATEARPAVARSMLPLDSPSGTSGSLKLGPVTPLGLHLTPGKPRPATIFRRPADLRTGASARGSAEIPGILKLQPPRREVGG